MGVTKSLRNATGGHDVPQVTGVPKRGLEGNMGVGDIRGRLNTRLLTLGSFGGTDSFKIRVIFEDGSDPVDTAAIVRGTNAASTDVQSELRTATGDTGLTVSGSTDAGPYTITPTDTPHRVAFEFALVTLSGCSGHFTSAAVSYRNATGAQTITTATNVGAGKETPLGYSERSDGASQVGSVLIEPVIDSAVGGSGQVVVLGTEDASGGTSAVVTYAVFETDRPEAGPVVTVVEDADGDVTISSLSAGDYYLIGLTQTETGTDHAETSRVSRQAPSEFFTVT